MYIHITTHVVCIHMYYYNPLDTTTIIQQLLLQLQDALNEIARQNPRDINKPLRVVFIGEDGIDAGGVKKEFFQLLIAELLCPDYGMLVFMPVCVGGVCV